MYELTLKNAVEKTSEYLNTMVLPQQNLDTQSPFYGAFTSFDENIDHAHESAYLISRCGVLCCAAFSGKAVIEQDISLLLKRMILAARSLRNFQRESGLTDLRGCNYDSSPDTGFVVQSLLLLIELIRRFPPKEEYKALWGTCLEELESFIHKAIPGLISGGFHTPNHRWVVSSALSLYKSLYPGELDEKISLCVKSYTDETIDIDGDGAFLERSSGGYDTIVTQSLMILAKTTEDVELKKKALAAVEQNLKFNMHLFHADGTIETGLSRRQDFGIRRINDGLINSYLEYSAISGKALFQEAAEFLWRSVGSGLIKGAHWTIRILLLCNLPETAKKALPISFSKYFPVNQIWRIREGALSASVFGEKNPCLLSLVNGKATLGALGIMQSYFKPETGRFLTDEIQIDGNKAVLISRGENHPTRPGYSLPDGKSRNRENYFALELTRETKRLPFNSGKIKIEYTAKGFQIHHKTLSGMDDVTAQIFFDFPIGGVWETEDSSFKPQNGQVVFLTKGCGRMRMDEDYIEVGPGSDAHRIWDLRGLEEVPVGCFRVIISLVTPIDYTFTIKTSDKEEAIAELRKRTL